jgi:hypothetical protein
VVIESKGKKGLTAWQGIGVPAEEPTSIISAIGVSVSDGPSTVATPGVVAAVSLTDTYQSPRGNCKPKKAGR